MSNGKSKVEIIKQHVTIPKYFEKVIVQDMPSYFVDYPADFDIRPVVLCPLHGEDTPSLRYYEETNTYYCFGCGSGGDVIKLHQEYMLKCRDVEQNFESSINYLYGTFIEGHQLETPKAKRLFVAEEEVQLSSKMELMEFEVFLRAEEKRLRKIPFSHKIAQAYHYLDDTKLMVHRNMVNSKEAIATYKKKAELS